VGMKRLSMSVVAVATVGLLGLCGTGSALPGVPGQEEVALRVASPENGEQVRGPDVEIRMRVTGVELTSRRSGAGGHLLLRLDDHPPVKSFSERFTFQGVSTGNHVVRVELRHTDGSAFSPPARAQVRFAVR